MSDITVTLHSITRWAILIIGIIAIVRGYLGWFGKKEWAALDDKLGMWFTIVLDVQILLGLLLYIFLSDVTTKIIFPNFGAAMRDSSLRFWAIEHISMMIIAVILAHVGRALSKKQTTSSGKYKLSAIFYSIAMLTIIAAIPWTTRPFPFTFRLGF